MKKKSQKYIRIQRSYETGKTFVKNNAMAGIVSLVISSALPVLQQWHSDNQLSDEISAIETRIQKQFDDNKREQSEKDKAQWQVIQGKKDK